MTAISQSSVRIVTPSSLKYVNALTTAIPTLLAGSYLTVLSIYVFTGAVGFACLCIPYPQHACLVPVFYLWRSKQAALALGAEGSTTMRATHKQRTRQRFQVPLLRLSANIANYALLEFPIAMHFALEALHGGRHADFKWRLCTGMRSYPAIWLLDAAVWPALMVRISADALIGFLTDPNVSAHTVQYLYSDSTN